MTIMEPPMSSLAYIPPGLYMILGALLIPFFRGNIRNAYMLVLPILGLFGLMQAQEGTYWQFLLFGQTLSPVRVDGLSLVFGYIFHIAAIVSIIFAFHIKDTVQQVSGLVYAGSAIGAAFAGDLITLFVYWEGTAISSVFLIWAGKSEASFKSGMRYLIIQIFSGVLLLAGSVIHFKATGSLTFDKMSLSGLGPTLIFAAFGIKAAFPLLHNWLQDAYPNATVTGTVFLSAFTTKLAIYGLARGFPGTEMLIWIGAVMAIFPIFYAMIENDLRRVLAYGLNNQLGFMVVGVGIGTELALNGTAAHAFAHILYKGLLFMSMGAVLYRTGTVKASELGGLNKYMPWTTVFCIVGIASMATPLFCGFVSKSLIISAAAYKGHLLVWGALLFASAGIFLAGLKIVYFSFFGAESSTQPKEAPGNMLVAMGLVASLCVGVGLFPTLLYEILPYEVNYAPYTVTHVVTQLQLLCATALAFAFLIRKNLFPTQLKSQNLDFDWCYRKLVPAIISGICKIYWPLHQHALQTIRYRIARLIVSVSKHHGPEGILARSWPTGSTVLWVAILLALYVIFYYV